MIARREGERGFSLIEAIVVVTITALLGLLIIPMMPRAASRSLDVAARGIDVLDTMRAEREFRALVRGISPRNVADEPTPLLQGDEAAMSFSPNLPTAASCARAGAPGVRLSITRDALVCLSEGRARALLRWSDGRVGALSYSADGSVWRANWNEPLAAPLVRFELRRGDRVEVAWVERAMGDVP